MGMPVVYKEGSLDKCSFQLIDENGTFNVDGLDNFIEKVKLAESGVSYAVISIMGPQSSGKSTLLNHLFGTNFKEMDAYDGRSQTTKGIWLANCANTETRTLVMDVEGTDGQERGQDDTNFERQSALFALAVSDIVLLNMWCHDIGREQAANKPLLRNVFQVMLTLFHPRKVTLMFVIRDKSKTPWEKLEKDLRKDIQMIWNSVPKSQAYKQTPLSEIFNVEVVGLSNYERDEHLFKNEVADLKQNIFHSILPGWLAEDRQGVVHASAFSLSTGRIWDIIKENKHLDLPKHSVMVATIRCKEILNEKFVGFSENEEWCELKEKVRTQAISGFGDKLNSLLNTCLSEYNAEAAFYDEGVRNAKWEKLKAKLLQLVQPACQSMLEHIRSTALDGFKDALIMALEKGTDLSVAVTLCTESSMSLFDEQYADATIELAEMDNSHGRDMLQGGINDVVDPVVPIFEMTTSGFSAGLFLGGMSFGALAGRQCAKYIKKYATKKATKAIERGSN